eukprot:scaffold59538_cov59-Attheya_sp.AAC.2
MDTPPALTTPMTTADLCMHVPHTDPSLHDLPSPLLLCTWSEHVIGASLDVWSMHPNKMQIWAVTSLVDIDVDVDVCGGKVLLVVKTGTGKSHHVMRTTGVLLGGVCLIIMPLLALGLDQVAKLCSANQEFGSVEYFHQDEYRDYPTNMVAILRHIEALPMQMTATMFLFCSPQIIQHDSNVRNALLHAHSKFILKSVFWMKFIFMSNMACRFAALKQSFFSVVFPSNNKQMLLLKIMFLAYMNFWDLLFRLRAYSGELQKTSPDVILVSNSV